MKHCPKCERERAESEFGVNQARENGLTLYCRDCTNAYALERRLATGLTKPRGWARKTADPTKYRREYARAHRPMFRKAKQAWLKKNPMRRRAKDAVCYAVRVGKLIPQPCSTCSATKTEAHHPDYSKPLDVVWLCRACHQDLHRKAHEKA